MAKIQVLGSGCPTCKKLYEFTQRAVNELHLKESVEYLTGNEGIGKIVELGSMSSPIVAVNDTIVFVGFTPDIEKLKKVIIEAIK